MCQAVFCMSNISLYTIHYSQRSRRIRLKVDVQGSVSVTAPTHVSRSVIDKFVDQHARWIQHAKKQMRTRSVQLPGGTQDTFHRYRARAKKVIAERVRALNIPYQFSYQRISVRNTKTRWGSCSSRGVLSFHYRLLFLPEPLRDYVIVHELCHLKEMNHSRRFWQLVAATIPEYRERRQALRQYTVQEKA